ncbi:MAG: lipoyl(octanoyl) transferase LipB [Caulobacterales bacterium]|nr:lipoyl(octanoyl) transferase LipB [Caulobacterales bacterium]
MAKAASTPVGWALSPGLTPYEPAVAAMEAHAGALAAGEAGELVWLLEHPPLYTAGASADPAELLDPHALPVFPTRRGGRHTYHGPGQRVAYVMLDVARRGRDVRAFVRALERWLIAALAELGVSAETREDRVGVWVAREGPAGPREEKIAAIGVRLRRWVSFHGVALNVAPNLSHFAGIVPCGLREHGVTSLDDLGRPADMARADAALRTAFEEVFGPTADARAPLESARSPADA